MHATTKEDYKEDDKEDNQENLLKPAPAWQPINKPRGQGREETNKDYQETGD